MFGCWERLGVTSKLKNGSVDSSALIAKSYKEASREFS